RLTPIVRGLLPEDIVLGTLIEHVDYVVLSGVVTITESAACGMYAKRVHFLLWYSLALELSESWYNSKQKLNSILISHSVLVL
ncbi:hypothetical protein L9F63_005660, partial [Diploptera punctata]